MTINTLYKEGEMVWTIVDNKVVCAKILYPYFNNNSTKSLEENLQWTLDIEESIYFVKTKATRSENKLFRTKEELIASL